LIGKATRLYPLPAREIAADAIYEDLELPPAGGWRDRSRPYVIVNMVASVDGKTSVGGKAAPLGSETDRQTMRNLRAKADAVMIGANTLRAEKLSLGLDAPHSGRQPLAVIVTASGELPLETNLVLGEGQEVLLLTSSYDYLQDPEVAAGTLGVPALEDGRVDLRAALQALKADHRVNLLVVEGGPALNHSLISESLADELFLTLDPKLLGGATGGGLLDGPLQSGPRLLSVLSTHLAGGELFLRYALQRRRYQYP
jgi:2,5-diamino-6-(ribosylamino)-4(3H)-pyrimidinone 5'-phosphate reductase